MQCIIRNVTYIVAFYIFLSAVTTIRNPSQRLRLRSNAILEMISPGKFFSWNSYIDNTDNIEHIEENYII